MIHVAVLLKPYHDLILRGQKTVECRLTKDARDPFENVEPGDRIYFKISSGPFAATAIVDHVLFESNLTPRRVNEIRRDYNDQICGEPKFWNWKRDARFCTLIWLKDIAPIDTGPQIRPLQGVAWLTLDEDPAWRKVENRNGSAARPKSSAKLPPTKQSSFAIAVTDGNVRNNSLYVTSVADRFPQTAFGGRTKSLAGKPITLVLRDGPTVQTDIVGPRNMLRSRVWGSWFRKHGVKRGDHVVFTPMDETTFLVGLTRA